MNLMVTGGEMVSTIVLREMINNARSDFGEPLVRNDQFLARVEDELRDEMEGVQKYYTPYHGNQVATYDLTHEQCMLVGMRESKGVRRSVLEKLNELCDRKLAVAIPDFSNPAESARAWADQYEQTLLASKQRDLAIATKAEIGSRREATAMATASTQTRKANKLEQELDRSKEWATVKRMEMAYHGQKFSWRILKSAAQDMGIPAKDVFDANYGTVKAYHRDVWHEAYALEVL